jgi:hypothetical protein
MVCIFLPNRTSGLEDGRYPSNVLIDTYLRVAILITPCIDSQPCINAITTTKTLFHRRYTITRTQPSYPLSYPILMLPHSASPWCRQTATPSPLSSWRPCPRSLPPPRQEIHKQIHTSEVLIILIINLHIDAELCPRDFPWEFDGLGDVVGAGEDGALDCCVCVAAEGWKMR